MARSRKVSNFVINKGLTKSELNEAYLAGQITDDQLSVVDTIETVIPDPTGNAGKFLTTDGTDAQWAAVSTNIEWKTKVDLPADYPNPWMAAPYYVISGGLPDGEYEFYFSTKCANGGILYPLGETIYKVTIKVDNTAKVVYGNVGYVFNGDYQNNTSIMYGSESRYFYMFHYNTLNGDFIIHSNELPFGTDALNYFSPAITIEDCFKMSAIKNKATGQEYITTGSMSYSGPVYGFNGETVLRPITSQPYIPMCHATSDTFLSQFDAQNGYVVINSCYLPINGYTSSTSTVAASFRIKDYLGELTFSIDCEAESYVARIIRATGVLSDATIGVRSLTNPEILVKLNATVSSDTTLAYSVGLKGSSQSAGVSIESNSDFTPIDITEVGGVVNMSNHGWVLQCVKETQGYTKGYFYEACGNVVTVPDQMLIRSQTPDDVDVYIDASGLVTALTAEKRWSSTDYAFNVLSSYYNNWNIQCDSTGTVYYVYSPAFGTLTSQAVYDCFVITNIPSSYTEVTLNFQAKLNPEHQEVQNGHWERVDAQPEGDKIQVDTMPAATDTPTGKVVQYVGTTSGSYTNGYFYKNNIVVTPESASVSQTSGSGLTDLAVNLNTFVSEEQPSGSETVDFVCNSTPEDIIFGTTSGFSCSSTDNGASLRAFLSGSEPTDAWLQGTFWYNDYNNTFVLYDTDGKGILGLSVEDWAAYNIIITTDNPGYGASLTYEFVGGTYWTKSGSQVNPTDYGITYTGTPVDQDILTVVYTAQSSSGGWDRIDVQPQGDSLPSQSGQSGKFLTTDGTNASWSDKPLVNKDTSSAGTGIGIGGSASDLTDSVRIGVGATAPSSSPCTVVGYYATAKYLGTALGNRSQAAGWGVAIGNNAINADYTSSVAIGNLALSSGNRAIAIGGSAQATADYSVLINASGDTATNNVAGSIMFSNRYNNAQHTYELVSADGTIPEARLADTTSASSGQVLSLDSNLNAVWTTPAAGGVTDVEVNGTSVVSGGVASITITDELPSQSGNAGKFLTTDGTDASWGDALVNKSTVPTSVSILANGNPSSSYNVLIGYNVATDYSADSNVVCVGCQAISGSNSVALGAYARARGVSTIQLNVSGTNATNDDVGTMKVANNNGNFELMSANGTIPTDRYTTTPSADGTYVPTLTIASGVATRTWGAAPSGGGAPTLTWYTVSTAGNTLTIADTSSAQLVKIYKNGLLLQPTEDYTISGTTLTTVAALVVGDKITTEVF